MVKYVATDFSAKSIATDDCWKNANFNSDSGEESEFDKESLQDAYENMYSQWIQLCEKN